MSDLVRFGQIEAVDAQDLLGQFANNIVSLEEKNRIKERQIWVDEETVIIKSAYRAKAKKALTNQWAVCGATKHVWRGLDFQGVTVNVCQDCGGASDDASSAGTRYNEELIGNLANRLIELDVEAGILVWPTVDDYKAATVVKPRKLPSLPWRKKKGGFESAAI